MSARYAAPAAALAALAGGAIYFSRSATTHPSVAAKADQQIDSKHASSKADSKPVPESDKPSSSPPANDAPSPDQNEGGAGRGVGRGAGGLGGKLGFDQEQPVKDTRIASNLEGSASKKAHPDTDRVSADKAAYRKSEGKDGGNPGDVSGTISGRKQ